MFGKPSSISQSMINADSPRDSAGRADYPPVNIPVVEPKPLPPGSQFAELHSPVFTDPENRWPPPASPDIAQHIKIVRDHTEAYCKACEDEEKALHEINERLQIVKECEESLERVKQTLAQVSEKAQKAAEHRRLCEDKLQRQLPSTSGRVDNRASRV